MSLSNRFNRFNCFLSKVHRHLIYPVEVPVHSITVGLPHKTLNKVADFIYRYSGSRIYMLCRSVPLGIYLRMYIPGMQILSACSWSM